MRQSKNEEEEFACAVISAAIEVHRVLGAGFLEYPSPFSSTSTLLSSKTVSNVSSSHNLSLIFALFVSFVVR